QGNFFFLDPSAGGTGPEVKINGTPYDDSQAGGWTPLGAEANGSGYEMAWHLSNSNLYTVWNLDNSGNYKSDTIGAVAGISVSMENLETSFHQDLNGDGVIGIPTQTAIESAGATALVQEGNFFFLNSVGGSTGPVVTMSGVPFSDNQAGGWTPLG